MYKKIYDYIVSIDIEKREIYFEKMRRFYDNFESGFQDYKEIGKILEELLADNRELEELEDMENFLWGKVYNKGDE